MPVNPGNSLVVADRVMYELLGRRWVWPPVRAVEEYETRVRSIHLRGRPVITIDSVIVRGEEILDYELKNGTVLELPRQCGNLLWASSGWIWTGIDPISTLLDPLDPACGRKVIIDYTYGAEAPEQVKNAIDILAEEIDNFYDNTDICRLPSRVKEISSRGIDMTLIDPLDFLDEGRTGIPEVDFALSVFNPSKAKKRARVYSSDYRPGRRQARQGS